MSNKSKEKVSIMTQQTVESLRKLGFRVAVVHFRTGRLKRIHPTMGRYLTASENHCGSKGGKTTVEILKNGISHRGIALCSSKDNYNRKIGVKIALNRAYFKYLREQDEAISIESAWDAIEEKE